LDQKVIAEVVEISYCDNTDQLNNKKYTGQPNSTAVESSYYHRDSSRRKNKDYQRSDLRGTNGTMNEGTLGFNQ